MQIIPVMWYVLQCTMYTTYSIFYHNMYRSIFSLLETMIYHFIVWIIFCIPFYLQDQYDNIANHTSKGIDFLEKYGHFVDQRCKIEQEYASKLR